MQTYDTIIAANSPSLTKKICPLASLKEMSWGSACQDMGFQLFTFRGDGDADSQTKTASSEPGKHPSKN